MSQNFTNGKIYKITNNINDEVYVGSTCDILRKRFSNHTRQITQESKKNRPLYKLMIELGCDAFRIDLIEDYPCEDKQALRQREGYWIRQIGTLNKVIAGRTQKEAKYIYDRSDLNKKKEHYEDNKQKIKEKDKKYYEANKQDILNQQKGYYEANKENILKEKKQYQQNNKDKINQKRRERYMANKAKQEAEK